jgi:hypothetical protein
MAKLSIKAGATSQSVNIFVQDSSSTVGAGLSGLAYNTSGLIAYYTFTGANAGSAAITLATLATVGAAYSSGGFKEIDSTNMKGLYRLDVPNAALASGNGRAVTIMLGGATNMAQLALEIELTGWDNQDAVHGGMSALPNVASGSAGAIPTTGTGANQIAVDGAGNASANLVNIAGSAVSTTTAQLGVNAVKINNVSAGSITTINANLGTTQAITFDGNNLPKVDLVDIAGSAVSTSSAQLGVNAVNIAGQAATLDGNNLLEVDVVDWKGSAAAAMTGDAYARLGAPAGASVSADIAAVKSDTGTTLTDAAAIVAQTNKLAFTVANQVDANVLSINSNGTAAANVEHTNQALCRGTVGSASTTTSVICSAIASPASAGASGQFAGRIILFDADTTTTNLQGQATNITGNTTGATPTFTVTALTTAPVSGDKFSIV